MSGPALRFALLFPALLAVLTVLVRTPWVLETLRDPLCAGLAQAVGALLSLVGTGSRVEGTLVSLPGGAIEIVYDCDGVGLACFFVAAALAFPQVRWRLGLPGLGLGILVITAANLFRLSVLGWLYSVEKDWFEFAHAYLFQGFVVVVTLVTWLMWVQSVRAPAPDPVESG